MQKVGRNKVVRIPLLLPFQKSLHKSSEARRPNKPNQHAAGSLQKPADTLQSNPSTKRAMKQRRPFHHQPASLLSSQQSVCVIYRKRQEGRVLRPSHFSVVSGRRPSSAPIQKCPDVNSYPQSSTLR